MKMSRIEIFKAMSAADKWLSMVLIIVGIGLFANGLYLTGSSGLLLVIGTLVFLFISEIYRTTEIESLTKTPLLLNHTANGSPNYTMDAGANSNDELIPKIIEKKKRNPQQGLLEGLMGSTAAAEKDEKRAKADHEFLVEMMRKKQEAMRTKAVPTTTVDPSVQQEIIEQQKAYIHELMEPTIIPQRELAEKAAKKDKK